MAAYDLISLDEFKRHYPANASSRDAAIREAISRASREIEDYCDRRLVYRAPPDTAAAPIVNAQAWAAGAITVAAQPNPLGRTLIVTWTTATGGVLTVTGTVAGVAGTTETFDAANGLAQHGVKFFTAISGVSASAAAAGAGTVTITSSEGYIEYHSIGRATCRLRPYEYPVQQSIEANEDVSRTFGTSTSLVLGTDYEVRERRYLCRLYARLEYAWLAGSRIVKSRYSGGYATTGQVPANLKRVCQELAAWIFRSSMERDIGRQSQTDGSGTWTGLYEGGGAAAPPMLMAGMKARLAPYQRDDAFEGTAERDFDLEVA